MRSESPGYLLVHPVVRQEDVHGSHDAWKATKGQRLLPDLARRVILWSAAISSRTVRFEKRPIRDLEESPA